MADIDLHVGLACRLQPVLQFVGKHHLRQLALRVGGVRAVARFPVHVIEPDRLQPHVVAEAGHDDDPAPERLDPLEEQAAEQEVAVVVCAQLALEAILGQLALRHLGDGGVADQRVDPGNGL